MKESEFTKEQTEAMLRGFRAETGSPVFVPPSLYAAAKALGLDMCNVESVKPLSYGPRLSSKGVDVGYHYQGVAIEIVDRLD